MGRSGQGGACLASSSLPSNMDSLERRDTRAGSLSSFEMAAWQSHAACEFLSGLTLRSQADVSREQQLSAGARELDDGGSALDPAAAPGALSLDDAQSPSVAGEAGGAGLLSKEGAWADTYAPAPPLGTYRLRVPASRVGYVPDAQGGSPPGPHVQYVLGTRTSLGRWVRTAYCGTPGGGDARARRAAGRDPEQASE